MTMRKVIIFFLLFLAFMGIVGGIGYTAYAKAYPIAVGVAVAGWMAYPKFKELFDKLTE
jgi:CBS domain containing-hemolysin-like protein